MKRMKCIVCILGLLAALSGCGKKSDIANAELAQAFNESGVFAEELTEIDTSSAGERYGINSTDYTELTAFVATKGCCDEFVIIKTTDTAGVTSALNEYKSSKKEECADYRPTEVSKLDNAVLTEYNGTVVMAVSGDSGQVTAVYEEYLKD